MARTKKEEKESSWGTGEVDLRIPAGTEDYITLLVTASKNQRGLLMSSPQSYILSEEKKIQEEVNRRSAAQSDSEKTERKRAKKAVMLPSEIAALAAYTTEDGKYYMPSAAFLGSATSAWLVTDAVFSGTKKNVKTVFERTVKTINDQCVLFNPETMEPYLVPSNSSQPPYIIHTSTGVNRNAGKRIVLYRPLFRTWGVLVSFRFITGAITKAMIQQGLEIAGKQVGVGAFRLLPPQNIDSRMRGQGGPFGGWDHVSIWDKAVPKNLQPLL